MATSRKTELLVRYLESYLSDLERWLKEWRITINVSKSTRCFSLAGASKIPDMYYTSGSQSYVSMQPVIWE
jgi:hypothetical protein